MIGGGEGFCPFQKIPILLLPPQASVEFPAHDIPQSVAGSEVFVVK
jgi:hypothetical protein